MNKTCEVHGETMKPMMVPFIYGNPIMDDDFQRLIEDRQRLFPNSHSHFLGGCHLGTTGRETEAPFALNAVKRKRSGPRKPVCLLFLRLADS